MLHHQQSDQNGASLCNGQPCDLGVLDPKDEEEIEHFLRILSKVREISLLNGSKNATTSSDNSASSMTGNSAEFGGMERGQVEAVSPDDQHSADVIADLGASSIPLGDEDDESDDENVNEQTNEPVTGRNITLQEPFLAFTGKSTRQRSSDAELTDKNFNPTGDLTGQWSRNASTPKSDSGTEDLNVPDHVTTNGNEELGNKNTASTEEEESDEGDDEGDDEVGVENGDDENGDNDVDNYDDDDDDNDGSDDNDDDDNDNNENDDDDDGDDGDDDNDDDGDDDDDGGDDDDDDDDADDDNVDGDDDDDDDDNDDDDDDDDDDGTARKINNSITVNESEDDDLFTEDTNGKDLKTAAVTRENNAIQQTGGISSVQNDSNRGNGTGLEENTPQLNEITTPKSTPTFKTAIHEGKNNKDFNKVVNDLDVENYEHDFSAELSDPETDRFLLWLMKHLVKKIEEEYEAKQGMLALYI